MKQDAVEVGKRIKKIRTDLGYSMSQFGELISGSPKTTVNNWERGINLPKEDKLKKIAILGKTTAEELLYGTPETFIANLMTEYFSLQVNPAFLQQIISFLKQNKVDLYDEVSILEFLQAIMNSGAIVVKDDPYLVYSPVAGSNQLYLASEENNPNNQSPVFYVYAETDRNVLHILPFTFSPKKKELYYRVPNLKNQVTIDYFTRTIALLGITESSCSIIYYGIDEKSNEPAIKQYQYNDQTKEFDHIENKLRLYKPFICEMDKMTAYLKSEKK